MFTLTPVLITSMGESVFICPDEEAQRHRVEYICTLVGM